MRRLVGLFICVALFVAGTGAFAVIQHPEKTVVGAVKAVVKTPIKQAVRLVTTQTQAKTIRDKKQDRKTINRIFKNAFSKTSSLPYLLLMAFLAGLLVSLTPCIYPMIPITASVLGSAGGGSILSHILRSVFYVLGIATIYSSLGYISATSSVMFGQWMGNPWVVGILVLFFLYLAFSMFGFYEVHALSLFGKNGVGVSQKRSLLSIFVFGLFSGVAASPCLSPPLAMLLGLVAQIGSPLFGFGILFAFALGMGSILILVGTFSSSLAMLPKPGSWMEDVKRMFGFLMLFACAYFVSPFFKMYQMYLIYGILCLITSLFYFVSARNESILSVMQTYKHGHGSQIERLKTSMAAFPIRVALKKFAALFLFGFAVYLFGMTYLRFKSTTALNVLIKLLR